MDTKIYTNQTKRIHITHSPIVNFHDVVKQNSWLKPNGLWYSIGDTWREWCASEEPDWIREKDYVYEITLGEKILVLSTEQEVKDFAVKYLQIKCRAQGIDIKHIDWEKVAKRYNGIEINPYFYSLRHEMHLTWYNGWDVPGGCIWREAGIREIRLVENCVEIKV